MSIQNIKKALFIGATLFSFNAHAQIEKGATSLGGSFNTAITKNGMSTNLSPSYGRFITNKIMIRGKIDFLTSRTKTPNYKYTNYDFSPEIRYYLNPQSTWKFFGGAAVGLRTLSVSSDIFVRGKFSNHDFHQSAYVGFNKFLNKDIALEGTLGVNHSNVMLETPAYLISSYGLTNVYTTGLNLSINNFSSFKSSDSNFEGLIAKGRTIIGGRLSLNTYTGKGVDLNANFKSVRQRGNYAVLNAEYGKFVANGLLIGVKTNVELSDNARIFGVTPYVQYYYPISTRFMVHAKAELNYNSTTYSNFGAFKGGIGATYFLSRNVALDFDVLNFNKSFNSALPNTADGKAISSNIGLRFFLK